MNPQNTGDPPPQALRSPRRAWTYVTAATFKFKYAGAAFLVVVLAAAAVATVLLVRHQADTRTLSALAERAAPERVDPELQARAQSIAEHAAGSEERRVGKEGRSRWAPDHLKKKKNR